MLGSFSKGRLLLTTFLPLFRERSLRATLRALQFFLFPNRVLFFSAGKIPGCVLYVTAGRGKEGALELRSNTERLTDLRHTYKYFIITRARSFETFTFPIGQW